MESGELERRLMATFLEELDDRIRAFNRDLLALEKDPPPDQREQLLQSAFREAHSLKGAARAVGIELLEKACHALEDLLTWLCEGRIELSKDLVSLFFRAADAIEESGMRLRGEQSLDDGPLESLLPQLQAFVEANRTATHVGNAIGSKVHVPEATVPDGRGPEVRMPRVQPAEVRVPEVPRRAADVDPPMPIAALQDASPAKTSAPSASVRVAADKLDALLAEAGELLVARQRIERGVEELESLSDAVAVWWREWRPVDAAIRESSSLSGDAAESASLPKNVMDELQQNADRIRKLQRRVDGLVSHSRSDAQYLDHVGTAIEDEVHHARMLPFAAACQGLERAVRDVAASLGKQVRLEIIGADVEVDRSVLEGLKDPLLHLARNAVDHGIESPQQRREAGKNPEALLTIEAALRGGSVEVCVRDDGGGINLQRIAQKAAAKKIAVPQDPAELTRLIFLPAFSTAAEISDVSGRGVGLDVVRAEIERLRGSVEVTFETGSWTCFTLTVPLTLTTIRAVMVVAAGQTFAIATSSVDRIVRFDQSNHYLVAGRSVLLDGDAPIALTGLSLTLGLTDQWRLHPDRHMLAAVLSMGGQRVAFAVDEIASEAELTVKNLGPRVRRLKLVSGASLLPSGELALVLNAANLIRTTADRCDHFSVETAKLAETTQRRLLVVDDSPTSRMLLRSILDAAGYEVSVAVDGRQALEMINVTAFDLVVSDIDMPRLSGIGFTEAVRKTKSAGELPVVLVTARKTEEDRARGLEAGANAYLVKSRFDQSELLQAIAQLL